jgi:hypothetical protein
VFDEYLYDASHVIIPAVVDTAQNRGLYCPKLTGAALNNIADYFAWLQQGPVSAGERRRCSVSPVMI